MNESYKPILKLLGQREAPDAGTIIWIAVVLVSIPLCLLLISLLKSKIRRRGRFARGHELLEKLGHQKDLDYPEQVTAERMATAADLKNASQILTSIDVFDQAAAVWMERIRKLPWLEMEEQLDRVTCLREKLGFRYLPADRRPATTRELPIGQTLYCLVSGRKGVHLLRTSVVDLDDLAIRTEPFTSQKGPVKLKNGQDIWLYSWTEEGSEYRYRSQVLKEVERPVPHLFLLHGESLVYDKDKEAFSCRVDLEMVGEWLSASWIWQSAPSVSLFDRQEEVESLNGRLSQLTGSGFVFTCEEEVAIGDLIRLKSGGEAPDFLKDKVGRVVKATSSGLRFRYVRLSQKDRDGVLRFIVPRLARDAKQKQARAKPSALA